METSRLRHPIDMPPVAAVLSLLSLLLLTPRCALAQPSPPSSPPDAYYNYGRFSPTMAVVIVVMISAFFFVGFFSIYIRNCRGADDEFSVSFRRRTAGSAARSRRQRGLSPEMIETLPTMVYAEVKEMKLGKGALECAVCLCEFDDDEELRLLPHCSHVFHPDCIDAWLASHVTCPVCRANLAEKPAAGNLDIPPAAAPAAGAEGFESETAVPTQDHVAILVDRTGVSVEDEKEQEEAAIELARIGSQRRAARSRSGQRPAKLSRSHTTGHSVVRSVEDVDRYTLRLPVHIRNQILAARKFHRSTSCVAGSSGQSRRGWGGGDEGSSRGWRSFRLRKSDRWPSFFFRSLSVKVPTWTAGRRGQGEGSVKKSGGDALVKGKTPA